MSPSPKKSPSRKKNKPRTRRAFSLRERNAVERVVRLAYCWRYVDHARAEAGEPLPDEHHGYNLLVPAAQEKIDAAYNLASGIARHWQVIVVAYIRDGENESRSWAWVKSQAPIIAAGDGITPLLAQANDIALEGLEENEACYARATIMAPWDASHPIRPDRLAARLQKRLGFTKEEILALTEWGEPETVSVEVENIDLELAQALNA